MSNDDSDNDNDKEYKEYEGSEDYDNEDDGKEDSDDESAFDLVASTSTYCCNKAKCPSQAPSSQSHMTKTSITPKLTSTDPYKDWDNEEALTPKERAKIMSLKLNYECAQAMNKCRNSRLLLELELKQEVLDLLGDLKAMKPKKSSKVTSKPTSTSQTMKATMRYV